MLGQVIDQSRSQDKFGELQKPAEGIVTTDLGVLESRFDQQTIKPGTDQADLGGIGNHFLLSSQPPLAPEPNLGGIGDLYLSPPPIHTDTTF